jgi:glycosyl transferase family 25
VSRNTAPQTVSHPLEPFERIYVVNLASRADRRAEMAEQFRRIGMSMTSPAIRLFAAVRPDDAGSFPSVGARGCFLSHLGVLRDAISAGVERVLIVEDDLNFVDDFASRSAEILPGVVAPECAIFYGGYEIEADRIRGRGLVEIDPTLAVRTTHFIGLQGAAIADAARYLETMLERPAGHPEGGPMHVDGAYSWFRKEHPHYRTWIAVPELGYQRASRTDIHDLRWFDRVPGARELVAALRKVRNATP